MSTVAAIADDPASATYRVDRPAAPGSRLRPLVAGDEPALAAFLAGLSRQDRQRYSVGDDTAGQAAEHCAAIGRYDKVRLVLDQPGRPLAGLFELSLDLVDGDLARFADHGIRLVPATTGRFGLCLAASERGRGTASTCMPAVCGLARRLGKAVLILWGGVREENQPARRFYRRVGFREVGRFVDGAGVACLDGLLDLGEPTPATGRPTGTL